MGLQQDLNISSALRSPASEFAVKSQRKSFPTEAFTDKEAQLLEDQLNQLIFDLDSSALTELARQRQDAVARTAVFAKQVFDEKLFGGVNAGDNEIGFSVLRPGHIFSDSTGTVQNDWYFDPGTTGWVDWIGDGTTANNYTVGENQVTVILAFMDQDVGSEVSAVNVEEFGRNVDMLPHDLNALRLRDNDTEQQVAALPTLIAQENDNVHVRLRADRNVESQPRLFGFTFGLGTFLDAEDY